MKKYGNAWWVLPLAGLTVWIGVAAGLFQPQRLGLGQVYLYGGLFLVIGYAMYFLRKRRFGQEDMQTVVAAFAGFALVNLIYVESAWPFWLAAMAIGLSLLAYTDIRVFGNRFR